MIFVLYVGYCVEPVVSRERVVIGRHDPVWPAANVPDIKQKCCFASVILRIQRNKHLMNLLVASFIELGIQLATSQPLC